MSLFHAILGVELGVPAGVDVVEHVQGDLDIRYTRPERLGGLVAVKREGYLIVSAYNLRLTCLSLKNPLLTDMKTTLPRSFTDIDEKVGVFLLSFLRLCQQKLNEFFLLFPYKSLLGLILPEFVYLP